jgi:hypothetical protein
MNSQDPPKTTRRRLTTVTCPIVDIVIDPWNATHLATQLSGDGLEAVTFGQGFKDMTSPTKELEKLVLSGKLRHGGHPVLRWMASNVAVEMDAARNLRTSSILLWSSITGFSRGTLVLRRFTYNQALQVFQEEVHRTHRRHRRHHHGPRPMDHARGDGPVPLRPTRESYDLTGRGQAGEPRE